MIFQVNVRYLLLKFQVLTAQQRVGRRNVASRDARIRRGAVRAARPEPIAGAQRYRRWKMAWGEREREGERERGGERGREGGREGERERPKSACKGGNKNVENVKVQNENWFLNQSGKGDWKNRNNITCAKDSVEVTYLYSASSVWDFYCIIFNKLYQLYQIKERAKLSVNFISIILKKVDWARPRTRKR